MCPKLKSFKLSFSYIDPNSVPDFWRCFEAKSVNKNTNIPMHKHTSKMSVLWRTKWKERITVAVRGYETCILRANLGCTERTELVAMIDHSLSRTFWSLSVGGYLCPAYSSFTLKPERHGEKGFQTKCRHFLHHNIKHGLQEECLKDMSPARNCWSADATPSKIPHVHTQTDKTL